MPDITWADDFFPLLLSPNFIPLDVKTVLDVGCGRGLLGSLVRIFREPARIVAIDVYDPYLEFVKKMGMYNEVMKLDLSKNPLPFEDTSFDLVICLEVIEHLKRDEGLRLLDELERVGKRVIISTPGYFFKQGTYDGNIMQEHVSLYKVKEFEARGYKVYGAGPLLFFGRSIHALSSCLAGFSYSCPRMASALVAVKNVAHKSKP
jgi:SAM-dependent methyltransferase